MNFRKLLLIGCIAALPSLATATEQGIRRHYGGDWLSKQRAKADSEATTAKEGAEAVAPSTPAPAQPTPP
jgi:hypothetical protein